PLNPVAARLAMLSDPNFVGQGANLPNAQASWQLAPRSQTPSWWVQRLLGCSDPEWLPCLGFLLLPAVLCAVLGLPQRVSFFAGMAVYLAVLKWLGWIVCPRSPSPAPA